MKFQLTFCLLFMIVTNCLAAYNFDPDIARNVSELISSKGYPVERHDVTTEDGYILTVHRIPLKKKSWLKQKSSTNKVIFLQHGLLGCSSDWVINYPSQSLGFILSDLGYDVWLGNVRGNTYGLNHTTLSPKNSKFWEFSFDEMIEYDLPAMIDYVLNTTSSESLTYIGHSQGTTMGFGLLSEKATYNEKIELMIALAPVATVGYISSPIRYLAPLSHELDAFLKIFGYNEFLPSTPVMKYFIEYLCTPTTEAWCKNLFFAITSMEPSQVNMTRIPVYGAHDPAGTSTLNIMHWAQMTMSKKFQKFDFGPTKNMIKYGQISPPEYYPENITTPVALFWSFNDHFASPTDVSLLSKRLQNLVLNYQVADPIWGHIDFILGVNAKKYVYTQLLKLLSTFYEILQ